MSDQASIPIIRTEVLAIIETIFEQVIAGAGLAILRGPAGIGKSFALNVVDTELTGRGIEVVRITCKPEFEGSIGAFARAVLAQYRIPGGTKDAAVDALADLLLSGYPFLPSGRRVVFVVDEAQGLKTNVLETIRGLWDMGDLARLGDPYRPAFGCVLIGNDAFLNKGGRARRADFAPLMSRVTHDFGLPRPSQAECAAFATALFPEDEQLKERVRMLGESQKTLRSMAVAARQGHILAAQQGSRATAEHLDMAIRMMGAAR